MNNTQNEPVEVTQDDRDCLDRVQACLRTAVELRAGGTCDETRQAIFWEDKACEHITRHRMSASSAVVDALRGELEWYGEQARLARLIHSEGDAGRHALQDDGGKRARAALANTPKQSAGLVDALREAQSSSEYHQLRGMLPDAVDALAQSYDDFMADDRFDAWDMLHEIGKRLRELREINRDRAALANTPKQSAGLVEAAVVRTGKTHTIKCWPAVFSEMLSGHKTAEFRFNDRGYSVGDDLHIREWCPVTEMFSGREITRRITHVLSEGYGMPEGYAMLSLAALEGDRP